jgi:hypothetical protein
MERYVYTTKAKNDRIGEAGEVVEVSDLHPLEFLLLHGYVELAAEVVMGALESPESKGSMDSPRRVKPRTAVK